MKRKRGHITLGLLITIWGSVLGQFFENPSFEGDPGLSSSPPFWLPLEDHSTPDTEPLDCDTFRASEGKTYLTLVTRGEDYVIPGSNENIVTTLLEPLEAEKFYRLTLDLASREDLGHFTWEEGFVAYTYPVRLFIFSSDNGTEKDILMVNSDSITNQSWQNFTFYLIPKKTIQHLVFEVQPFNDSRGFGNLLLDNLQMDEVDELPLEFGDLEVPNVFTPNGDGVNDQFMIRGLVKGSKLMVFDRTGREVYMSENYEHDWDGKDMSGRDLPPETYWYILFHSQMPEVVKGFVYLKRE